MVVTAGMWLYHKASQSEVGGVWVTGGLPGEIIRCKLSHGGPPGGEICPQAQGTDIQPPTPKMGRPFFSQEQGWGQGLSVGGNKCSKKELAIHLLCEVSEPSSLRVFEQARTPLVVSFLDELGLNLKQRAKLVCAKGPTEGGGGIEVSTHLSLNAPKRWHFLTPVGSASKKSKYHVSPRGQLVKNAEENSLLVKTS